MSKRTEIRPQPGPQTAFVASSADIVIYGGAAGSGKTFGMVLDPLRYIGTPGYTAVFFRREVPQIRAPGGLWDATEALYPMTGATGRSNTLDWKWPSGAWLKLAGLQLEKDKRNWDGSEICGLYFDELIHFSESQFWYLISRNRSTCGVKPYCRAGTNPEAGTWVAKLVEWWVGPDGYPIPERAGVVRWFVRENDEVVWVNEDYVGPNGVLPRSLTFIPAKIDDNPALMQADPTYRHTLESLEPHERARLLEGNWKAAPLRRGRIYPEFNRAENVLTAAQIEHWEAIMSRCDLLEGWDFGSGANAATAIVWVLRDRATKRLCIWDDFANYERPFEHYAEACAARGYYTQRKGRLAPGYVDNPGGRKPLRRVGDPAGNSRGADQESWFSKLRDYCDINLVAGHNRPMDYIAEVGRALRGGALFIHPQAEGVIAMFERYRWDVPDGYDAETHISKGVARPLKDAASHTADAVGVVIHDASAGAMALDNYLSAF